MVALDNERIFYLGNAQNIQDKENVNSWYEESKEYLLYGIADNYYLLKDYSKSIENYKSALFYLSNDDNYERIRLYEELLLQYKMIDNIKELKLIYPKVIENLDQYLGKQMMIDHFIDTNYIGNSAILVFNIKITTQIEAKPLLMFDCNSNNIIDPSIDKVYYLNPNDKLEVVNYNKLLTEDLLFNGTMKFNYFNTSNNVIIRF